MGHYEMTQAIPRAAAALQEMGYSITILSLDRYKDKPDIENINDWQIIWYHGSYKPGHKLSFLWMWIRWWIWVIHNIFRKQYSLIQAFNLESVIPCVLVKPFRRFKLVFDVRDPWGMNSANSNSLMMRIFKLMERWTAARVDGIVLSQGILDKTGLYFGNKVQSRIPSAQVLNVPGHDIAGQFNPPNTNGIRLNFSGHISYVRNAQAIIDLATEKPDVQVDVIGEIRDDKLRSFLRSLPNIKLYGLLPFNQAMELLQQANLVTVMYDTNTEVAVVSSANKMFEAMMMSRPYVASERGYPGIIAEKYSLGWSIPYGDSRALIDLVSELLACPSKIESAARNARKTYEDYFTWDKQKANLISLYTYVSDDENMRCFSHAGWDRMLGTVLQYE